MKHNYDKGFTLIELMIVVAIVTILAAISSFKLMENIKKAEDGVALKLLGNLRSSKIAFESDNFGVEVENITQIAIYIDKSYIGKTDVGLNSGKITSFIIKAGTVKKGNIQSIGRGKFTGLENIAEIYYDNVSGDVWIDGTTGSGVDFVDTKGNLWNKY